MVFKVKGILEFNPVNRTKKHRDQALWKRVAMIRTYCDMDEYYRWFLKKRFNLELNSNLRGTHVTIINDRMDFDAFENASEIFNGKEIEFYVDTEPRSNGKHWWLRVYCPEAESIREVMGLSREPYLAFHLTLGYALEKYPDNVMDLRYRIKGLKYELENKKSKKLEINPKLIEEIKILELEDRKEQDIKIKKDYMEHSDYITECCIFHELISNGPRKPLSEHELIEFKK